MYVQHSLTLRKKKNTALFKSSGLLCSSQDKVKMHLHLSAAIVLQQMVEQVKSLFQVVWSLEFTKKTFDQCTKEGNRFVYTCKNLDYNQ